MLFDADYITKMIRGLVPLGHFAMTHEQAVASANLGFGFLYYGLVRALAPERIVVVGSFRGFSPVCFALGLRDNGAGHLDFVDAAMVDGFWKDPKCVTAHFSQFGVADYISHFKVSSSQYLQESGAMAAPIDLLFIDGDHSFAGVEHDYQRLGDLVRSDGYILLHDSYAAGFGFTEWEVADFLGSIAGTLAQTVTFTVAQGLTLIKRVPQTRAGKEGQELERALRAALEQTKNETTDMHLVSHLIEQALALHRVQRTGEENGLQLLRKANQDLRSELVRIRARQA